MDVKVDHVEGHVAKLTVHMAPEETQNSKQKAARRIAKQIRIPGFRPGKAPYRVVEQRVGSDAILMETVDNISDDVFRTALDESDVQPAAAGEIHNYEEDSEGRLKLVFTVPKQAEVDLEDYRSYRAELDVEEVTDERVMEVLENLREQKAVVEEVERPAKIGDALDARLLVTWWHEEEHDHHDEEAPSDDEEGHGHQHVLIDEEDAEIVLREADDNRDMMPGFSAEVVGMSAGDEKTFSLELPDDFEDENLAGEVVNVEVEVLQVHSRTLPELNDTFAASATDEDDVETLLDLRIKIREDLEEQALNEAKNKLYTQMLEHLLENADLHYHQVMVDDTLEDIMGRVDSEIMQQRGFGLDEYLKLTQQSKKEFREQFREQAVKETEQRLLLLEFVNQEQLSVSQESVDDRLDELFGQLGESGKQLRGYMNTPEMRANISNSIIQEQIRDRMVEIAQGNAPDLTAEPEDDAETGQQQVEENEKASE